MTKFRLSSPHLDDHAMAIGWTCIMLSQLEATVGSLVAWLAYINDKDVRNILDGHTDINQKVMMAKGLGFLRPPPSRPGWFERLNTALDGIRTMQDKRNRFVHDSWTVTENKTERIRKRVAFKKPQSREPVELTTIEQVPVDVEEIWTLAKEIYDAEKAVRRLLFEGLFPDSEALPV